MKKNEFTTKGATVTFNGKVGVVMKALDYKTVIDFEGEERWVHLRHNQNDMNQLKAVVSVPTIRSHVKHLKEVDNNLGYSEAVRKSVKVLNAPMGLVADKQIYITMKCKAEGFTTDECSTIFLEALNIASNGELLRSV